MTRILHTSQKYVKLMMRLTVATYTGKLENLKNWSVKASNSENWFSILIFFIYFTKNETNKWDWDCYTSVYTDSDFIIIII